MRGAALLALALALAAGAARAQTAVALRAGDQDGLSRLVLDLPPATRWQIAQTGRRVTLRFPGTALAIDATAISPGRAAARVLEARPRAEATGTVLALTLSCDCSAAARLLGPRTLVLDITDAPPPARERDLAATPPPRRPHLAEAPAPQVPPVRPDPAEAPAETAAADHPPALPGPLAATLPTEPAPLAPPASPHPPVTDHAGPPVPPAADAPARAPAAAPPAPAETGPVETAQDTPPPDPAEAAPHDVATAAEIEAARKALLEKLSRAAEQGLVDLVPPVAQEVPESAAPRDAPAAEKTAEAPSQPHGPGIAVRTARDRDRRPTEAEEAAATDPACLPDAALDLAAWGAGGTPAGQIAEARAALVGEFDRAAPEAVATLARRYLSLGFGAEAEALIAAFDDAARPVPDAALLNDLARVLDGRVPPASGPLTAARDCPGAMGMWGWLARLDPLSAAPPSGLAPPAAEELKSAFEALPPRLRRVIGPRLVRGLLRSGEPAAASDLLALIRRAPGSYGDDYYLAQAAWLQATGDAPAAEAIWRALIARNRPNAPEAMVALSESRLARGLPPPDNLAGDLSSAAFAQRHSEEGVRLRQAEIEARAAEGDLPGALARIAADLAAEPDRAAVLRALAARVLARSDPERSGPARYAAAVLGHGDLLASDASADPARLVVSAALIGIGLPNAARALLAPALARGSDAARMTAAAAALAMDDPAAAQKLIAGLDSREAGLIRAAALARGGDYHAALAALPPDAPEALRARYAFAAGQWDSAQGVADPVDRLLAAYMAGRDPAEAAPAAAPADPALARTGQEFLTRPATEGPITLESARRAAELARSARELLAGRIAPGG